MPQDPVAVPTVLATANAAQRQKLQEEYDEKQCIYKNAHTMDEALKQHIIGYVDNTYVSELRHRYTGCLGVTTRDLLNNVLGQYDKILPIGTKDNYTLYNDPVDTAQPINKYFKQLDDCVKFAGDGKTTFLVGQILSAVITGIMGTVLYMEAIRVWKNKPVADQT